MTRDEEKRVELALIAACIVGALAQVGGQAWPDWRFLITGGALFTIGLIYRWVTD